MKARASLPAALLVLLTPVTALAHRHNMSDFVAASVVEGTQTGAGLLYAHEWVLGSGGSGAGDDRPDDPVWGRRPWSLVFDTSLHFPDGAAQGAATGGLRLSLGPLGQPGQEPRVSFSVQAVAGVQLTKEYGQGGFMGGFGAGFDYMLRRHDGIRVQGDLLSAPRSDGREWKWRLSIGWVRKRY